MLQFADPDRLSNKRALEDLLRDEKYNRFLGWNWAGGVRNRGEQVGEHGKERETTGRGNCNWVPIAGGNMEN